MELTAEVTVNTHQALLTICTQAESFYRLNFATGVKPPKEHPSKRHPPKENGQIEHGNTLNVMLEFETELDESGAVQLDALTSEPTLKLCRTELDDSDFKERLRDLASSLSDHFKFPRTEQLEMAQGQFGFVAHECGTMRMGTSPDNSVVDEDLKVHKMNKIFVCDLSVFPFSPMANPALTLTALAMRLGDFLDRKEREAAA